MSGKNIRQSLAAAALTAGIGATSIDDAMADGKRNPFFDPYYIDAISEKCNGYELAEIRNPTIAQKMARARMYYDAFKTGKVSNWEIPISYKLNDVGAYYTLEAIEAIGNYKVKNGDVSVFVGVVVKDRAKAQEMAERVRDLTQNVMEVHKDCGAFVHSVPVIAYDSEHERKYGIKDGSIIIKMSNHPPELYSLDTFENGLSQMFLAGKHASYYIPSNSEKPSRIEGGHIEP